MTEEEKRKEWQKYMEENYPYCKPCIDCFYWRYMHGGTKDTGASFTAASTYSKASVTMTFPCCHYTIFTGKLRDEYMIGECKYFTPRDKGILPPKAKQIFI